MKDIEAKKELIENEKIFVGILKKTNLYLLSNASLSFIAAMISNYTLSPAHPLTITSAAISFASLFASILTTTLKCEKENTIDKLEKEYNKELEENELTQE